MPSKTPARRLVGENGMIKLYTILSSLLFMMPLLAVSQENGGISPDISQEVAPKITSQETSKNGDLNASDTSAKKEEQ